MTRLIRLLNLVVLTSLALGVAIGCATSDPMTDVSMEERTPVLGPSDVVEIRVFGEPELTGVYQVTELGTLRLPLIGEVPVAGTTAEAAQIDIERRYNEEYLRNGQITLYVKSYNSRKIYILGQVKKPGPYEHNGQLTIIGAIALAGGATRLGNLNGLIVTRGNGSEQRRIIIDANEIQRGHSQDIEVVPGDIIFVPESLF